MWEQIYHFPVIPSNPVQPFAMNGSERTRDQMVPEVSPFSPTQHCQEKKTISKNRKEPH
jgi:hypothetical protein